MCNIFANIKKLKFSLNFSYSIFPAIRVLQTSRWRRPCVTWSTLCVSCDQFAPLLLRFPSRHDRRTRAGGLPNAAFSSDYFPARGCGRRRPRPHPPPSPPPGVFSRCRCSVATPSSLSSVSRTCSPLRAIRTARLVCLTSLPTADTNREASAPQVNRPRPLPRPLHHPPPLPAHRAPLTAAWRWGASRGSYPILTSPPRPGVSLGFDSLPVIQFFTVRTVTF